MPSYTKHCNECDELFDVFCKIADKDLPKECPHCGGTDSDYQISAPMFSSRSDRLMGKQSDSGFKDVIGKIQKAYPRTEITQR